MLYSNNPYAPPAADLTEDELGEVLFQRRASKRAVFAAGLAAVCATAFLLMFASDNASNGYNDDDLIAILGLAAISLTFFPLTLHWAVHVTYFHQQGILTSGLRGRVVISYAHLVGFTFMENAQSNKWTLYTLIFRAMVGRSTRRVIFSHASVHRDDAILAVRDHVAALVADRMYHELKETTAVEWTDRLRFAGEVLEHRPARGPATQVPLADYAGHSLEPNACHLFRVSQTVPFASEYTVSENFYPGLVLLERLAREAHPTGNARGQ